MEQLQHNEEAKTIKQAKDDSSNEQSWQRTDYLFLHWFLKTIVKTY